MSTYLKKMSIELDWDTIDKVMVCSMKSVVEGLKNDLVKRENNKDDPGIFHHDQKQDIDEIKRHLDAFKTVLAYYGEGRTE